MYKILLILFIFISCNNASLADDLHEEPQGWLFYNELLENESEQKKIDDIKEKMSPREKIEAMKVHLENLRYKAIENPTVENVAEELKVQKELITMAEKYAKMRTVAVRYNPELDESVKNPTSQYIRRTHYENQEEIKAKNISNLKNEFGLFFFYSTSCKYCQQFAPVVKLFEKKHKWFVQAISVDGGIFEQFPNTIVDSEIFQAMGMQYVPALVAMGKDKQPLFISGATSLTDIEDKVSKLYEFLSVSKVE